MNLCLEMKNQLIGINYHNAGQKITIYVHGFFFYKKNTESPVTLNMLHPNKVVNEICPFEGFEE